jgi:hypothetical protein
MQWTRSVSHTEAERALRRAGYSQERIEEVMRQLPDPLDLDRDADVLFKLGVDASTLTDRMGASP